MGAAGLTSATIGNGVKKIGCVEGLPIAVYSTDGQLHGSSIVSNGQTTVSTNLQAGSIAIVKIGDKAVKVVVR